jgi:hypothetical protein
MPRRQVPGTNIDYYLVLFDADGNERIESSGQRLSEELLDKATVGVTDVFVLSHGWKGDIPAAISQYDAWIGQMGAQEADRELIRQHVPGFSALVVAVHWPSLPWGVEGTDAALLGDDETDELLVEEGLDPEQLVEL